MKFESSPPLSPPNHTNYEWGKTCCVRKIENRNAAACDLTNIPPGLIPSLSSDRLRPLVRLWGGKGNILLEFPGKSDYVANSSFPFLWGDKRLIFVSFLWIKGGESVSRLFSSFPLGDTLPFLTGSQVCKEKSNCIDFPHRNAIIKKLEKSCLAFRKRR